MGRKLQPPTAKRITERGLAASGSGAGGSPGEPLRSFFGRAGGGRRRQADLLLVGLLLVAFGLQASGLVSQGLWRDEVDAIRFARRPLAALLETFRTPGQNGPLYYLLLRPWLELAGQGEFALRFFSTLFGVLAVALTARLGRRLFPARPAVGLLAALLAATAPYLVWYGQEGKMYTLVVALVLLSTERYTAALLRGGWQRWLAYVVFTSLLFYVHLTAVLIVPAQALAFFLVGREVRRARWKGWLASLAALTVPYLPLLAWQWPLLRAGGQTGYAFVPLPQMVLSLLTSYSLGVVGHGAPWALVPFVALLLAVGLGRAWPGRALRAPRGILLCWLVVPVVGFFLVTLLRPIYTARYLIFVLPAYLLLLAVGLEAVARHSRLLAAALLLGLLALNGWGLWLQARTPLKADFRAATAYVVEHRAADDLLLFQIPYGRHSFDYYRSQQAAAESAPVPGQGDFRLMLPLVIGGGPPAYSWAEGLYTNAGMAPEEAARQMAALTAGYRGVWLVATEVPLWDERGLVQAWLEEHAVREEEAHFVRVDVYYYRLEGD